MTLMTDHAGIPARATAMASGHPCLGKAPEATVVPVGLDCYQIVLHDEVKGYICSAEDGWECFAGARLGETRPIGRRHSITVAIRDLCREP